MRDEERVQLEAELEDIQNHISFAKLHIDELAVKFARFKTPSKLYLSEYNECRNKLDGFARKEEELKNRLHYNNHRGVPPLVPPGGHGDSSLPSVKEHLVPPGGHGDYPLPSAKEHRSLLSQPRLSGSARVRLGDHGHTVVQTKKGVTAREALAKPMKMRKLSPETCAFYRMSDPQKKPLPWNMDVSDLDGDEIKVEVSENFSVTTSISHNFYRKTFLSLTFCECCRRLLFSGFCCRTCGYRFHQRCEGGVPKLCEQERMPILMPPGNAKGNWIQAPPSADVPSVLDVLDIDPGSGGRTDSFSSEPHIKKGDRAHSTPNMHATKLGAAGFDLPETLVWKGNEAVHTKGMVHLDELFGVTSISSRCSVSQSSMAKSSPMESSANKSMSVSSSLTGKLKQPRTRASSGDDTAWKKIKAVTPAEEKESIEDWEISAHDIKLNKNKIGQGSFGTVYRGYWHGNVAVKTLNVKNPSPEQIQAFRNEVALLRKTRHANILLFMGCVSNEKMLAIITQWCDGTSLHRHIHVDDTQFKLLNMIEIARQTSQGMEYLHAKNIIHRDLKSNNIFLHDDNFTVKIGDFGLATVKARWKDSQQVRQPTGSVLWLAPEVIKSKTDDACSFQSDVYAFGIVVYELLTGILPYSDGGCRKNGTRGPKKITDVQILFLVGTGQLMPNLEKIRPDAPANLRRLLLSCIRYDREERPLFSHIIAEVEDLMRKVPKISHSQSEPELYRSNLFANELNGGSSGGGASDCSTPKTPCGIAAL